MPNNWIKYKLIDVCTFQRGFDLPIQNRTHGKYPIVASNGIIGYHNEYKIKGPGVLTGRSGSLGEIIYTEGEHWPLNTTLFIKDFHNNLVKYIYYFLKTLDFKAFNSGTSVPTLNRNDIHEIEVEIPSLPEQQAIAEILSSLDDKIELNLQTNKTLEEMANALYKHWFVDFGPFQNGKFAESELGLVPINWEVKELKENLSILKDGSHNPPKRTEEGVRFLAGATDIKHLTISFEKCSFVSQDDYDQMHKKYHIQKDDILLTIVGTIGNVAIVRESDLPFSMQRSIAILRANDTFSNKYIYLLLNSLPFKHYINTNINPTGQPGIYLGTLGSYKLVTPPINELKRFEKIVEPFFDRMFQNVNENETIKQTRDYLLPKLISGEIRVKDAAKKLQEIL